jgi:long-chain acyl-CoA synthetase
MSAIFTPSQLVERVDCFAREQAESPAIIHPEGTWSWAELGKRAREVGSALLAAGVGRGDRVVIAAAASTDYIAAILGIARVGAVTTPLSMMISRADAHRLIDDAAPSLILTDAAGREHLGLTIASSDLAGLGMSESGSASTPTPDISDTSPMSIIYSSGTTGLPKGIVHSIRARDAYGSHFAREYGITRKSVTLLATAPYSNGTWMMILPTLNAGGCLAIDPDLSTANLADTIERYDVTHCFLVPTQLAQMFDPQCPWRPKRTVTVISAGSHLPAPLKQRIVATPNVRLFELYGNTEGVCSILRPDQMEAGFESVGTAIEGGEIAIVDAQGKRCPTGQTGEIVGTSTLISDGYLAREELSRELEWLDEKGHRFVRSGDLGEIDANGFLHLRGRIKDMIVTGGINVYPSDIEAQLRLHPDVLDAAVIGVAHDKWGETPCAFIETRAESEVEPIAVMEWANTRLGKHQRISECHLCEELPRNALGKVVKPQLLARREAAQ